MAPKIIAENQISVMIPTHPRTSFFPSIWPNWVSSSPEKEGMNWRIPSISFSPDLRIGAEEIADGQAASG